MRRASFLIIFILIVGSLPLTTGKGVEEPTQRDVFLYEYFSNVMVRFEYSLKYALANESYGLRLANLTLSGLELINTESLYYKDKGINSPVMEVIPPFYEFAQQLVILTNLTLEFHRNPTPALAAGITGTTEKMNRLLDIISLIKLRNGTDVMTFNTGKVRKYLEEIQALASKVPPTGKFIIGVSTTSPILYQKITIFGSCPKNETVTIVISGGNFTILLSLKPLNGMFSTTYAFDRLGTYSIYATQVENRSNTITVTVEKIPSIFLVEDTYSAFLNQTATVSGKLIDYYGKHLGGRNITIGNESLITKSDGSFSKEYLSRKATSFEVPLKFAGDITHSGTSKIVTVEFRRYPVTITTNGPSKITLGEEATFKGNIQPNLDVPLTVYVNNRPYINVTPKDGNFSFTLKPEKVGDIQVYVAFPGNDVYDNATSNIVTLAVVLPVDMTPRYIAIILIATILLVGILAVKRKKRPPAKRPEKHEGAPPTPTEIEELHSNAEIKIPEDVGEAYHVLREKLKERFGISESLTPREVLRILKEWELYPYLERVTLLHEKAIYGNIPLTAEELAEFTDSIRELIEGGAQ